MFRGAEHVLNSMSNVVMTLSHVKPFRSVHVTAELMQLRDGCVAQHYPKI